MIEDRDSDPDGADDPTTPRLEIRRETCLTSSFNLLCPPLTPLSTMTNMATVQMAQELHIVSARVRGQSPQPRPKPRPRKDVGVIKLVPCTLSFSLPHHSLQHILTFARSSTHPSWIATQRSLRSITSLQDGFRHPRSYLLYRERTLSPYPV